MKNEELKYILLKKEDGTIDKKRILTIFELEKYNKDYVIFYDDDKEEIDELFVASYDKDTEFKNLNTNLSEDELKYANKLIEVANNNGGKDNISVVLVEPD